MNTPHHTVAIPEVSLIDRVEIITLILAGHTISLQIIKVIGLKTRCPKSQKPPDKPGPVSAAARQANSNEESLNSNGLGVKRTNA